MPQSLSLHGYFSVKEILTYYGRLGGLSTQMIPDRVSTVLQFVNLSEKVRVVLSNFNTVLRPRQTIS